MIYKRGVKGLVVLLLLLILVCLFSTAVSAATVADVANNSLRVGDDIYELGSTAGYTYENVLASLDRVGGSPRYYFKIDNRWYNLTRDDINTLSDLRDPEKAVPAAEVRTWLLTYRYGPGDTPEELEPLASTYSFDYGLPGEALLAGEDINITVGLSVDEQGAVGYDAAQISFSAEGPGSVSFKTAAGEGEQAFENEGVLDPFALPADYTGSSEWTLCFGSSGYYTITFKLVDSATDEVIARRVREIEVYPSSESVLADLEAGIRSSVDALELEGSGVSGVGYAAGEALVRIDEPDRSAAGLIQSLVAAFRGACPGVTGSAIYVGGGQAGVIENPAAMSDEDLIEAIGRELLKPLVGGQEWQEAVLGDLDGKSAAVELIVTLGAAEYSAFYGVEFAVNRYSVSVVAENGTVEGAGSYAVGAAVMLEAAAGAGYEFYNWCGGEGEEVSRSNPYAFAMPNRDLALSANIFRAEAIVDQDSTLEESFIRVDLAGSGITLDLDGNTVVHLSITGSNVTLKNGTVVNLEIGRGVENVTLEDINDGAGGNHYFAGGGSDSVFLKGRVLLKGTVHLTSREALGIRSLSPTAVIGGDLSVETIMPVAIAAPVQGEVRLLASSESVAINAEVARVVALADAVIRISSGIEESKRPQVVRAAGVDVTVSIVDEHGEEIGCAEGAETEEGLSPADIFIFSIAPVTDEIKVNCSYILPASVEAVLSDRTREDVAVDWLPSAADTTATGRYLFNGTVAGYDEAVELALIVYMTHLVSFEMDGGSAVGEQEIRDGEAAAEPTAPTRPGYTFDGWFKDEAFNQAWDFNVDRVTETITLYARWKIKTYAVTFMDYDGTVLDTQAVEHGGDAIAPPDPTREGYVFTGWDTCFEEVKSDLAVTAKYIDGMLAGLRELIAGAGRTRPEYTASIAEWNNYWSSYLTALGEAAGLYEELKEVEQLTEEQVTSITAAESNLQRALEIVDGILDFDLSLSGREDPLGLVETVYDRSVNVSGKFQYGRLRCYYEKPSGNFYWMLSGFVQEQGLYEGTSGTGMNPGLQNVMLSESIVKLQSGEHIIYIYHPDGTRKTKTELENEGVALAIYWLEEAEITPWIYASLVGLVEDCKLIGRTSDGTEFERTYSFRFVDGGTYLFDPDFRYCVVDDVVQKDFEGYNIINVTQGLKYTGGTIQAAVNEAEPGDYIHLAADIFNESVTINKGINLIGSYWEGAITTVLSGKGISGTPGITIAGETSDVNITGLEITGFDAGGIVGQGGANNIAIENNYLHDLGGDGLFGGAGAAQTSAGWTVAGNRIEGFGGSGISFENTGELVISNNRISQPAVSDGYAVGVTVQGDSDEVTVSGITIVGNELAGGAINVTVMARGNKATANEVVINNNTVAGGSVEVYSGSEDHRVATIDNVSINGNTIEYPDKALSIGTLACPGNAYIRTVAIKNNEMIGCSTAIDLPQESGYNNLRNFTISGNSLTVADPESAGCALNLAGVKGTSSFTNNTVTVTGNAGGAFDGIAISGTSTGTWLLTGNELLGSSAGAAGSGIRLADDLTAVTLNINKNRITGWGQGVHAGDLAAGTTVILQRNLIYGNSSYGISNGSGAEIEAILNYWGHPSGPQHGTNPVGSGDAVTDNVSYDPWFLDEGFEERSDGAIHNARLNKYYREIQAAVDEAAPGDTIRVKAGVYNEGVAISKSITLTGVTGDLETAGPGENAPVIDGTGKGDNVSGLCIVGENAKNVVIEGFEIKNFLGAQASGIVGCGETVSDVTVRYNHIHHVTENGLSVSNAGGEEAAALWEASYNKIESCGGSGIHLENVRETAISKNEILDSGNQGSAILIRGFSGDTVSEIAVEDIDINGNTIECAGRAVSWQAEGDGQIVLKDFIIRDNIIVAATGIHAGALTRNVAITGNSINGHDCGAENLGNISGSGIFSGNTVEMSGDNPNAGVLISGEGAAEWSIDDNVLIGSGAGLVGIRCLDVSALTKIEMNRNRVTGWTYGVWIDADSIEITLRSNLIYDNFDWGVLGEGSPVDAILNYWGDESGPWPEGNGNGVSGDVEFVPWYIDEDCTVDSDYEINDQDNVDAAVAKVPDKIDSLELPFGGEAGAEEKRAAVKAYIENLEGMAALRVIVTVEDGSSSGYKVIITRGEAVPGIKDNIKVTFVAPTADQEAAETVEDMIDDRPLAKNVNIDNFLGYLADIEATEAAYNALTEPQKALVDLYLVNKLFALLTKIEELVLEELDNRILSAIDELKFEGSGIGGVQLVDRKATLFVDDPDEKVHRFVESGVVDLFESMFQDVVGMRLGNDPVWYAVEGTTAGAIEAGAQIVSSLLGIPYEHGVAYGGVLSQLAAAKLSELIGKSLSIEVKIERLEGGREYTGSYIVEFEEAE